ncbi:MAG TPA: hypothetical protein VF845_13605, partial [Terriglobales bacterium]
LALPAAGQIVVGDNLNLNLNGIMSAGYSGVFGNQISSSHGLNWGGNGTLSGSYYNPNFLSFTLSPYYNQARQNSEFRSLFNNSGFDFNTNIFSGSHFPGSVGFSRSWDSQGNFSIPGLPDFTTRSSGRGFSIGWGAFVPDWPSLTATFNEGSSEYSIPGAGQNGSNGYRNFALRSGYRIKGFNLSAGYNLGSSESSIPLVLGTQTVEKVHSDNNSFTFSASHLLPMHGSFGSSFSRSSINADYLGSGYHGTVDVLNANAGVNPTQKLNFSVGMGYTDSLTGSLFQSLLPGNGGGQPATGGLFQQSQMSSSAFSLTGAANYAFARGLQMQVDAQRRQQTYLGNSYGANTFGGSLTYSTAALGGFLSASANVRDNNSDNSRGNSIGFSTNLAFNRSIQGWFVGGDFSYAQNVQAYLITYMNSFYVYSGNLRRRFFDGRLAWSASAAGSHSALTGQPHTGNSSQSYSTSLGLRHWTAAASYAKSDGFGLLSGAGLIQPPNLPPGTIPPDWIILYGGNSYSFSLGASPIRKLSLAASFSKARSNTSTGGVGSFNNNEQVNAILNYQLRKLTFTSGYGRLLQSFSASGVPPANVNSFFVGFSRSFNFF